MNAEEITVFIEGAKHYFRTVSDRQVEIGSPYLVSPEETPSYDYTGIIGISGAKKGCVYFSAPSILLRHLLISLGEEDQDAGLMGDVIGEVANTISGNARASFGSDFMISVPVVVNGRPDSIKLPKGLKAYVIPVDWDKYQASLVVCIE